MVSKFRRQMKRQADWFGRTAPDMRYVRLGVLAAIVLSVVSFITTWFGFRGILTFGADDYLLLIVAWVLAFMLTFGVQAILLVSVFAYRATKKLTRLRWFATYLIAVFISVGFGYGFYFDVFSAKRLQTENSRKVMRDFVQPLADFEASYAAFVLSLNRMTTHAERMAQQEQTRGGTCGDRSGKSFGPRTQLRLDDAAAFKSFNGRFDAQLKAIRAQIAKIKAIDTRVAGGGVANKLNQEYLGLRQIINANTKGGKGLGADLVAFRQFLLGTQVNRGRVARRVVFRGRTVRQSCPDPFLQAEARSMVDRINALNITLPPPPSVFNAKDRVEVIGLGFYRLMQELGRLPDALFGIFTVANIRGSSASNLPKVQAAPGSNLYVLPTGYQAFRIWWFPLLVGMVVDILIFLAAYTSEGRGDVKAERIIGETVLRLNPPQNMRPAMAAALKAFRHGEHVVLPAAWTGPPLHDPDGTLGPRYTEPTPVSLVSGVLDVLMAHKLVAYRGQMKADKFLVRKSGWYSGALNDLVLPPSLVKARQKAEPAVMQDGAAGAPANGANGGSPNGAHGGNGHAPAAEPAPDPIELGSDADVYIVRRRVFEELLFQLQNAPLVKPVVEQAAEAPAEAEETAEPAREEPEIDIISERRRIEYTEGKTPPHEPGKA